MTLLAQIQSGSQHKPFIVQTILLTFQITPESAAELCVPEGCKRGVHSVLCMQRWAFQKYGSQKVTSQAVFAYLCEFLKLVRDGLFAAWLRT